MLSLIIPTYNYVCTTLVADLLRQAQELRRRDPAFDFEILVWDDASTDASTVEANAVTGGWERTTFRILPRNVGRAVIRNRMAEAARGEWLLFIDCDAEVCREGFLESYWTGRTDADILCGGLLNPAGPPAPGHELRFRYEQKAMTQRSVEFRNRHPYFYFSTFNVMAARHVFARLRFDERCREYGYEDTLFGLQLRDAGFSIKHMDNPLVHLGIDLSAEFLSKTEAALRTLSRLGDPMQSVAGASKVTGWLQRLGLRGCAARMFRRRRAWLVRRLTGPRPSLKLFALYKVGYYAQLQESAATGYK